MPNDATQPTALARFAVDHQLAIIFVSLALCVAGVLAALRMPSSVFPQTDFPRCVILVDNGVMPADEMMAAVTRPIEEAMKDIPGALTVRSSTGRGAAEISVFFTWQTDMVQAELYVNSRLAQARAVLPATATTSVWRLTFSAFPIIGVSLTSPNRDITELWEKARYDLKPRFLRIPGVARVDLVGGRAPEYQIIVDPLRLSAAGLGLAQVGDALKAGNVVMPAGMHEEDHRLYLTVVDGRAHGIDEIADFVVAVNAGHPIRVRDFARVERGPQPVYNIVTADGVNAVLLNIRSQPDGSTLQIADALRTQIEALRKDLPPDMKLAFFYDQSVLVRSSVDGVAEAMLFGLLLSIAILFLFLRNWSATLTATAVIPVTVLVTILAMKLAGMSFNLMTLGGIAAAIGLVIDDAIVVVEAIHARLARGAVSRVQAVQQASAEIFRPLVASTLTPVVVFIPLAFLDGLPGVFFRALALTMVVALLCSLVLALSLTPALAGRVLRDTAQRGDGRLMQALAGLYERAARMVLAHRALTALACFALLLAGAWLYTRLESDFLPELDEGGYVLDYTTPWGTSLADTHRQLMQAEQVLRETPEVESYSRRTGARLALAVAEPNTGDFLVKLRDDRQRSSDEVLSELRLKFRTVAPGVDWDLHGILGDLIGDLAWSPKPIEIKLYSTNAEWLKTKAPEVEAQIKQVAGVVDSFDGLVYTGPGYSLRVRNGAAQRYGLTADSIGTAVATAMQGLVVSSVLEGDRLIDIRVRADQRSVQRLEQLRALPLRTAEGRIVQLSQVADVIETPGQLELQRQDLRQEIPVSARLEGRDLGSAMAEIRALLAKDPGLPAGSVEFGGLYEQQQASFQQLLTVLAAAVLLVFTVLLIEFRSLVAPVAIVFGALLSLFGSICALWLTHTTLNVVSLLGAIIGIGLVAKNGILMLDFVARLQAEGLPLHEALVQSGRRRLRPVLMTSLAAALGMLPLAWGVGSGSAMLKPLAIAVMGALCLSLLLCLLATPVMYSLLCGARKVQRGT